MRGVITHREVVRNLGLIAREFGLGCLLRCLLACATRQRTTFLEVAFEKNSHRAARRRLDLVVMPGDDRVHLGRARSRRHGVTLRMLVVISGLLVAGSAWAQALEGSGRISVLGGWRLTPNDHFYENANQRGFEPLSESPGGPVLTGTFAYAITDQLELGIDLFAAGEQLELDQLGMITSVSYGALVGLRLQWPLALGGQSAGLVPYVGLHSGPTLVFVTDEVKGGVERFTQAWAGSAGLTWRPSDQWGLTLEYKLMLVRGVLPEVGSLNGGGSWFGAAITYYLPSEGSSRDRGASRW